MIYKHTIPTKGIALHSRYNPQQQAERYLDQQIDETPRTLLLVGAGHGYIVKEAVKKFPYTKIIALHAVEEPGIESAITWAPSSQLKLDQFLASAVSAYDLIGLQIIYWQPGCKILKRHHPNYLNAIQNRISQLQTELVTLGSLGRRYLINTVRNMNIHKNSTRIMVNKPPLIVAPGPSFDRHAASIKQYREHITLLCVSSSLKPLLDYGITPDIVFAIDAGFYAAELLRPLVRQEYETIPIVAFPQANIPSQLNNPVFFMGDTRTPEGFLCRHAGRLELTTAAVGTVTAAAMNWALGGDVLPVAFVGLDLTPSSDKTHCKNHSSTDYIVRNSCRTTPYATSICHRKKSSTQALQIYREWFTNQAYKLRNQYGSDQIFVLDGGATSLPVCSLHDYVYSSKSIKPTLYRSSQEKTNLSEAVDILQSDTQGVLGEWRRTGILPHTRSISLDVLVYSALPNLMQNNPDQAELSWYTLYEHMKVLANA